MHLWDMKPFTQQLFTFCVFIEANKGKNTATVI